MAKRLLKLAAVRETFLVSLCELGNNRGVGFDNSYAERPEHVAMGAQVKFIQDFYSDKYAEYQGDLLCCRQVLEHIQRPGDFLRSLYQTLSLKAVLPIAEPQPNGSETAVFFEVPNALYTFRNMMIWDIIYEHCTYFTPISLRYVFAAAGYRSHEVLEEFGGQFISIEASVESSIESSIETSAQSLAIQAKCPPAVNAEELAQLSEDIAQFKARFESQMARCRESLSQRFEQGKKVVIWGAGSKGVTFLNLLNLQDEVEYAVDINPRKHDKFIPGTGQQIVTPDFMETYRPDVVIVMNPLYQQEIQETLAQMKLHPEILTTEQFA